MLQLIWAHELKAFILECARCDMQETFVYGYDPQLPLAKCRDRGAFSTVRTKAMRAFRTHIEHHKNPAGTAQKQARVRAMVKNQNVRVIPAVRNPGKPPF